jgi:hypothetical protein
MRGDDERILVNHLRAPEITPHVAAKDSMGEIEGRATRHAGSRLSQRERTRIEETCGWLKTLGLMRKTPYRGRSWVGWISVFVVVAHYPVRMRKRVQAAA